MILAMLRRLGLHRRPEVEAPGDRQPGVGSDGFCAAEAEGNPAGLQASPEAAGQAGNGDGATAGGAQVPALQTATPGGAQVPALQGVQTGASVELPETAEVQLDDQGRQWVKLLPYGQYTRQWGDPWVLSQGVASEMASNFASGVIAKDLAWNLNHRRGTEAAGWIAGVEAREDGLYVLTEWTELGQEMLDKKLYRYCSAEWHWEYQRPADGMMFRNVLSGAALTNDPFFTELPALAEEGAEGDSNGVLTPAEPCRTCGPGSATPSPAQTALGRGEHGNGDGARQAALGAPQDTPGGVQMTEQTTPTTAAPNDTNQSGDRGGSPGASAERTAPVGTPAQPSAPTAAPAVAAAAVTPEEASQMRAQIAALEAREERRNVRDAVGQITHPNDPARRLAPALAELWTDLLVLASDASESAVNTASAGEAPVMRTQRERMMDLIAATAGAWPSTAQPAGYRPAEDASGLSVAEKRQRLHELVQAAASTAPQADGESANDWYDRRLQAVLKEHPELV